MKPAGDMEGVEDLKGVEMLVLVVAALFILILGLMSWFWVVPRIPDGAGSASARIEFLKTMAQITLGGLVAGTLYISWRRVAAAERTVEIAREGQITERFTRAIDQLGSAKVPIRLGGAYALERIARDSGEDRWPVMQVLMDCIPRRLRWDLEMAVQEDPYEQLEQPVTPDKQAILAILGRLNARNEEPEEKLNLRRTDLRGADLREVNFQGAILVEARLEGILLNRINLRKSDLRRSDFRCAVLFDADLQQADLGHADFRGADLTNADLRSADLTGANFQWGPLTFGSAGILGSTRENPNRRTLLKNADLRGATLKHAHFEGADLTNADFRGADLAHSHFRRAWVTDTQGSLVHDEPVFNTILTHADLQGADVRGTDFSDAVGLTQAQVDSATSDQGTRLPYYLSGDRDRSE